MIDGPIPEGLTFDDVLLQPGRSSVLPVEVDTTTNFTRSLVINIPLASSAMDTVTESRLAIAIARQGGIGIIHRNLSIDRQFEEIDRVKRSESGMIVDPVTISPDITIRGVALMAVEEQAQAQPADIVDVAFQQLIHLGLEHVPVRGRAPVHVP